MEQEHRLFATVSDSALPEGTLEMRCQKKVELKKTAFCAGKGFSLMGWDVTAAEALAAVLCVSKGTVQGSKHSPARKKGSALFRLSKHSPARKMA